MRNLFFVAFVALFIACVPASTAASPAATWATSEIIPVSGMEEASSTPSPLVSNSPVPSKTLRASLKTPTGMPTSVASVACLHLTRPGNGASLSKTGNVGFAWESQPTAQLYVLSLISQAGIREDSRTIATTLTRSLKAASKSDSYYWSVSAYDAQGHFICNSGFLTFSRGGGGTNEQASVAVVETDQQALVAADPSSATYTYQEVMGLIVPPQHALVPFEPPVAPPFPLYIDPGEFPAEDADTYIVPPAPPATPPPQGSPLPTYIIPPALPPTLIGSPQPAATDPPAADPPATDAPATDPPAADPPATDAPASDPPAMDPPATDPPAVP